MSLTNMSARTLVLCLKADVHTLYMINGLYNSNLATEAIQKWRIIRKKVLKSRDEIIGLTKIWDQILHLPVSI